MAAALAQAIVHPVQAHRRKYHFTPAVDEEIRRAYHLFLDYNNRRSISACARRLQVPRWAINREQRCSDWRELRSPNGMRAK
jgi:hypothetical protein